MTLEKALLLFICYGIPIFFFIYMATDVLLRNRKKTEHILLSVICICYLLLFSEEYIRNQLSVEYSPMLSAVWLSSVGLLIPGIGFHFLIKFTHLDKSMPRWLYPYVFYLPAIFVIINLVTGARLISAQEFVQSGMWNLPVYNSGYYIAMSASIGNNILYIIPLFIALKKSALPEQKAIYKQLIFGVTVAILWHVIFGYINYGDMLPPYPYLYSGMVWCYFLRHTMKKYDFLNLYDKRYEKLFNMNPDSIMLMDFKGMIKNANPKAEQLLAMLQITQSQFISLLDDHLKEKISNKQVIHEYETEISYQEKRIAILVNADYVWVDNEQHILFILRDISVQKQYQEEIIFLAYHDPLTRLPNRRFFYEKLDEAILRANQNKSRIALMLIDLDRIKLLNDNFGHLAGDEALQATAAIIKDAVQHKGTAARMGGDEFILFIENFTGNKEIELLAKHMHDQFVSSQAKYGLSSLGMSIGISFFPEDAIDGQALINIADNNMYDRKKARRA